MSKIFTPEEAAATLRHCVNEQHCMECAKYPHLRFGKCTMKLCAAAADTIEALIEENKRLREENRWISTAERLPQTDDGPYSTYEDVSAVEVLAVIEGAERATTLYCDGYDFFDLQGDEAIPYRVTHWKPMPKGPEVGHDNQ